MSILLLIIDFYLLYLGRIILFVECSLLHHYLILRRACLRSEDSFCLKVIFSGIDKNVGNLSLIELIDDMKACCICLFLEKQ